jgi:hypothetical protein
MDKWAPEDVEAHMAFLKHVSELLEENGEYVDAQARPGRRASHHRRPGRGAPVRVGRRPRGHVRGARSRPDATAAFARTRLTLMYRKASV